MEMPRIMLAAPASGSGKTTVTCALMEQLKGRGGKLAAAKCGPDYIDPMFHRQVLGIDSQNLDLFFSSEEELNRLFCRHTAGADMAVIEGVMGYYDGMSLKSAKASSYDVARVLQTPVVLVVPAKGMALSILALIKGMIEFKADSNVQGIILNRVSAALYPEMKAMIETGLHEMGHTVRVLGYLPDDPVFHLKSRHLGLVTPDQIADIRQQIEAAGKILAETIDLEGLEQIAREAPVLPKSGFTDQKLDDNGVRIGVARDEAFGFYYKDNLELLTDRGCEIVEFSPLYDRGLPAEIDGLLLGGGYPELYGRQLSENKAMRTAVKAALNDGMPCIAECGGFMYLQQELTDEQGHKFAMAGVLPGCSVPEGRLVRFGYINIEAQTDGVYLKAGEQIRGHEFHHWDSSDNGADCQAVKPGGRRSWPCIHMKGNLLAGYPHLYFHSQPVIAERFVAKAKEYEGGNSDGNKPGDSERTD